MTETLCFSAKRHKQKPPYRVDNLLTIRQRPRTGVRGLRFNVLTRDYRFMRINSSIISSAVVMIFEAAE